MYDGAIDPTLATLGVCSVEEWKASGVEGLVVLRSTVMDPFLDPPATPDHVAGYVAALRRACTAVLESDWGSRSEMLTPSRQAMGR